jgi:hypothetical protein
MMGLIRGQRVSGVCDSVARFAWRERLTVLRALLTRRWKP